MPKFRTKPVVIEAIQFDGANRAAVAEFTKGESLSSWTMAEIDTITIPTLGGEMQAAKMDWIIKGVRGEFYSCKPDIFSATYEEVEVIDPCDGCNQSPAVCTGPSNCNILIRR